MSLPDSLAAAIAQAQAATQAAIDDGLIRLQVELLFPELKVMPVAQQFVIPFEALSSDLRVIFPDAGNAALARRDWGEKPYPIRGIVDVKANFLPTEKLFIFVEPSSVEVERVEKLCQDALDRPVVFLNPRLEDVATIGIGYAGRQLRERFLNLFQSSYYIRPLEGAVVYRCYPSPWQVWVEQDGEYQLVAEAPQRPMGEALDQILMRARGEDPTQQVLPKRGLLSNLQQFLRALSQ